MGRAWLFLAAMVVASCSTGGSPIAVAPTSARPAVTQATEPRVDTAVAPATIVPEVPTSNVPTSESTRPSSPDSQAEFDALSFAERLSLARSALNELVAGRASRTQAYAPALSLVRSIPSEAPEAFEAREIARSLAAFRPTVDEVIASTPPEQRLNTAMYLISQVFKDPTRTDLLAIAQRFIAAIPTDVVVDQEKLVTVKNAILVLQVDRGARARAASTGQPNVPGDGASGLAPDQSGILYTPSAATAPCASCPSPSYPKTVRVREYTRRDGTTVHEHTRSSPRR
jgi:hypothetical protein